MINVTYISLFFNCVSFVYDVVADADAENNNDVNAGNYDDDDNDDNHDNDDYIFKDWLRLFYIEDRYDFGTLRSMHIPFYSLIRLSSAMIIFNQLHRDSAVLDSVFADILYKMMC